MDYLSRYMTFLPEKVVKSTSFKVTISFFMVSLATIFEHIQYKINPETSVMVFYPLIMVSLLFVHGRSTMIMAAIFLQFFVLSRGHLQFSFSRDLPIQIIFCFSNLMILTLSLLYRKEILKLKAQLEHEATDRFKFTSALARVTKTPIHLLKMASLYMKEQNPDSEKYKKALELVGQKSDELEHFMNDVLGASHMAYGRSLDVVLEKASLRSIVVETIQTFKTKFPDRIVLELTSDGMEALWDKLGMKRVVEALCSNAVEFGNERPVEVSFIETQDLATLKVLNFGDPIPQSELKDLFLPFRSMIGGSPRPGLNLTLVKGIVEAHGGNIKVVSNEIEGTFFQVLLPRKVPLNA